MGDALMFIVDVSERVDIMDFVDVVVTVVVVADVMLVVDVVLVVTVVIVEVAVDVETVIQRVADVVTMNVTQYCVDCTGSLIDRRRHLVYYNLNVRNYLTPCRRSRTVVAVQVDLSEVSK